MIKIIKWNWGKGIVLGMLAFMSFILYMVITMSTSKKYSHDLVTNEYYAKEMAYQTEIDAEANTKNLSKSISGSKTPQGWLITFPEEIDSFNTNGKVILYRPSNQELDFEILLKLTDSKLLIPDDMLVNGRWNITIEFTQNEINYLYKKSINY